MSRRPTKPAPVTGRRIDDASRLIQTLHKGCKTKQAAAEAVRSAAVHPAGVSGAAARQNEVLKRHPELQLGTNAREAPY